MSDKRACPRCEKRGLKTWAELTEEERLVVNRLPKPADLGEDERKTLHRWCTRCWYEEVQSNQQHA